MSYTYRLHPRSYNIGGTESFYSRMAAKGLKLTKHGLFFSRFERHEPEDMKYRVEIVSPELLEDGRLPEEQVGVYEDCGWEYAGGRDFIHIFRAPSGSEAPEFYLEPQQQAATLKSLRKEYIRRALQPAAMLAVFVILSMVQWSAGDGHWTAQLRGAWTEAPFFILGFIFMLAGFTAGDIWGSICLGRLYGRMKKGVPIDHGHTGGDGVIRSVQIILLTAAVLLIGYDYAASRPVPLPEYGDAPLLMLADMGIDGERKDIPAKNGKNALIHTDNFICQVWSGREFTESEKGSDWMFQKIYRFKNPVRAQDFVRTIMINSTFAASEEGFREVNTEGLDRSWISDGPEVIALKDGTAAIFTCYWTSDEQRTDCLEAVARKWNR